MSEQEIREDLERVHEIIDALKLKYGPEFSVILSTGVDDGDHWIGQCSVMGEDLHTGCHALLDSARFVDEFFNAVKCTLHDDDDAFANALQSKVIDSIKKRLIVKTDAFKKFFDLEEADKVVQDLLSKSGF